MGMTNDEIRMTNQIRMTNDQMTNKTRILFSRGLENRKAPSPPYSGERVGVRGHSSGQRNSTNCPSPQPSPLSTEERELMHRHIRASHALMRVHQQDAVRDFGFLNPAQRSSLS